MGGPEIFFLYGKVLPRGVAKRSVLNDLHPGQTPMIRPAVTARPGGFANTVENGLPTEDDMPTKCAWKQPRNYLCVIVCTRAIFSPVRPAERRQNRHWRIG